ncbi:MAG: MoxR family ATPase [Nanoarchaeota archaeon]|nr:MoxR family ATPase [Nanoarchaeota archaeon]MBU1320773.1 MoxR family ATPase [Nanoarchaeota archaeon]MBU1598140.1 MoxR family ATPase [Nanoarchaeota archaeon]MBU2442201.1 MoxR family ATPase [Nanoarchaeota archaeon]
MAKNIESVRNIEKLKDTFSNVTKEISKIIVGQEEVIEQIMIAILADGNALLESYPGLGKTTMVKTIADVLDLKFSRIQNTPDLMPSDIIGTYVIEEEKGKKVFRFQKGPIFANIILADEINRATPKTQSAMLEAMQEKQVTVGNQTFALDQPFFVLATQNPIDMEGTYPLPEAQVDRFLLKILVDYPGFDDEMEIINRFTKSSEISKIRTLLSKDSLKLLQNLTRQVPIADDIKKRALEIVAKTRTTKDLIEYGASPRASIGLILAAKAKALINGRKYVSAKDIEEMAYPVLRHRLILNFKAEREGKSADDIIREIMK